MIPSISAPIFSAHPAGASLNSYYSAFSPMSTPSPSGIIASSTLGDDLIAHWKFNDGATDEIASHDMTEFNSPTYVTGVNDEAINFNGTNQYAVVSSHSDFDREALDFSWVIGFKPDNLTGNHYIVARWGTSLLRQFYIYSAGTALKAAIQTQAQINKTITSPVTLAIDSWYLIELAKTGTVLSLRVNEETKATLEMSAQMRSVNQDIFFGTLKASAGYTDGKMDFAEFRNAPLTDDEWTELYNSGSWKGHPY